MASLRTSQIPLNPLPSCRLSPPPLLPSRFPNLHHPLTSPPPKPIRTPSSTIRPHRTRIIPQSSSDISAENENHTERPPFDLNVAVLLAGFAFEAYTSPPENVGRREIDAAGCQTVFLSEQFLHEVYDGQLFIKLKRGVDLPALDPWGTSDPYVIIQLDGQIAKSNVKWATKEPIWNEDLNLNIKISPTKSLQVMAWDANLVTPHKRMGNVEIKLESLLDGNLHEVEVELEGIGGGGRIYLEVKYKNYSEIDEEKPWWRMSFVSDFLMNGPLGPALKTSIGSQSVNTSKFVEAAFGQLRSLNKISLQQIGASNGNSDNIEDTEPNADSSTYNSIPEKENVHPAFDEKADGTSSSSEKESDDFESSDKVFWKNFADILNQSVLQKFGFSLPEIKLWEGSDLLNTLSAQSQRLAEVDYVEFGLATPQLKDNAESNNDVPHTENRIFPELVDIKKASRDVLNQTETILGALVAVSSTFSQETNESSSESEDETGTGKIPGEEVTVGTENAEEMKKLFSSAESAMEAWSMLATSMGGTSFIKSEFEKLCFLDNASTDTQICRWQFGVIV